jgi:hypothetical protein
VWDLQILWVARLWWQKHTSPLRIFCLIYLRDFVLPAARETRDENDCEAGARYFICGAVFSNAGGKNCPINYTRDSVIVTSTIFHVTFLFITKGRAGRRAPVASSPARYKIFHLSTDLRGKMLSAHRARAAIYINRRQCNVWPGCGWCLLAQCVEISARRLNRCAPTLWRFNFQSVTRRFLSGAQPSVQRRLPGLCILDL